MIPRRSDTGWPAKRLKQGIEDTLGVKMHEWKQDIEDTLGVNVHGEGEVARN